ncbi:MAG: hypothetical protein U0031_00105 [Thermomicrobiales bacterium]
MASGKTDRAATGGMAAHGARKRHGSANGDRHPKNGRADNATRVVLYVAGDSGDELGSDALRTFPLTIQASGESRVAHLQRVVSQVEEALAAGGTHLVVPPEAADWLQDHPLVSAHLIQHHHLVEASDASGVVFALRPAGPVTFSVEVSGWRSKSGKEIGLVADRRLVAPRVTLRPRESARGSLRGRMTLETKGIATLRLAFTLTRPDRARPQRREAVFSLARLGNVFHDLPFFQATVAPDGTLRIEYDLALQRARTLDRIDIEVVEEDNWRVHPTFPGGASFALPDAVPAGARLAIHDLTLMPVERVRKGPPHGIVRGLRPAPYRKSPGRPRDVVIFSSWVPRDGLALGEYFIDTLCRWHADSRIFVGVNHGSSPRWLARLRQSGLDVTVHQAAPTLTMPYDPTGFVAALDAYRRCDEPFDLVWFGHNKGGDHLQDPQYATGRWTIERMFWSRRAEIEHYFANPIIGLYTPHYLMLLQQHLTQTDALQQMYAATCSPLHVMAVSAHYVMRDESVREFCAKVDSRFFRYGPEPFGGDRFFFEMAMPNVPLMQGYEPYIEPGLGGTRGVPKVDGLASFLNDWRQNNAVAAIELEKWRRQPTDFHTRHREHLRID